MTGKAKKHSTDISMHTHAQHKCAFGQNLINYPQPEKTQFDFGSGRSGLKNSDREVVGRDGEKRE